MDEKFFYTYIARIFKVDADTLGPETRLREDLNATSQACFAVSALVEKLTGKKVNFADINVCDTLADVIALANN